MIHNPFNLKWSVITTVSDSGFNKHYISALKKAGFKQIGGTDVFGDWFNSTNPASVARMKKQLAKLNAKLLTYKHKKMILAFTITDKQFGLIGQKNKVEFAKCKVPCKLGTIPVTYEQMYESGCIPLPGSQARYNHPNKF